MEQSPKFKFKTSEALILYFRTMTHILKNKIYYELNKNYPEQRMLIELFGFIFSE